jgi:hypothetical protein
MAEYFFFSIATFIVGYIYGRWLGWKDYKELSDQYLNDLKYFGERIKQLEDQKNV